MSGTRVDDEALDFAFDHHSAHYANDWQGIYGRLHADGCPIVHTTAHGGYWVAADYESVSVAARDDATFSCENHLDGGPYCGITQPGTPVHSGMLETDPPRFRALRRAVTPRLAPSSVEGMKTEIDAYTHGCIDAVIERGEADLVGDVAAPVPSLLTLKLLGLPPDQARYYADITHRGAYIPPGSPERGEVDAKLGESYRSLYQVAAERRGTGGDDLITLLANLEIDGELMPLDEVAANAFLFIIGGLDTTTALLGNTFVYLHEHPEARQTLIEDPSRLTLACEEFLRYYTPVQGLARTINHDCVVGEVEMHRHERLWLSWAGANHDPAKFDKPDEVRMDRSPNPHTSFGFGAHRCVGSHAARAVWKSVVGGVLARMPDYAVDVDRCERYASIGIVNGLVSVPVRFTPGARGPLADPPIEA